MYYIYKIFSNLYFKLTEYSFKGFFFLVSLICLRFLDLIHYLFFYWKKYLLEFAISFIQKKSRFLPWESFLLFSTCFFSSSFLSNTRWISDFWKDFSVDFILVSAYKTHLKHESGIRRLVHKVFHFSTNKT